MTIVINYVTNFGRADHEFNIFLDCYYAVNNAINGLIKLN